MIKTTDVSVESKLAKTFGPGNIKAKLNKIALLKPNFPDSDGQYFLAYQLEGQPLGGDFEGFSIDPQNPSGEKYKGQIATVKTSMWPYKDGVHPTRPDLVFNRNNDILRQLKILATALGKVEGLDALEASTIEEFVPLASDLLSGDKYLEWCIGGKEYLNKNNFTAYELFLPKPENGKYAFETLGASPSKLQIFDQDKHIIKKKAAAPVQNFAASPADLAGNNYAPPTYDPPQNAGGNDDEFDLPF